MTFVVRAAPRGLAPFVDRLGYYETDEPRGRELVLPTGAVALLVNLSTDRARWYDGDGLATVHTAHGAAVLSPAAGRIGADVAEWHTGAFVSFRPGGAYPFLGVPLSAMDEPLVALDAMWGRSAAVLQERLMEARTPDTILSTLETALLAQVTSRFHPDHAVGAAAAALAHGATVTAAADQVGLTDRTLRRRFAERVGLSPKRYARVLRLRRLLGVVSASSEVDWARAAVECGYFDQAHLINEFRALTGMTPSAYRPRSISCRNHDVGCG
jgi:AraC-like DNA-binding protein